MAYDHQIQCASCGKSYASILDRDVGMKLTSDMASKTLANPRMGDIMKTKHLCFVHGFAQPFAAISSRFTLARTPATSVDPPVESAPAASKSRSKGKSKGKTATKTKAVRATDGTSTKKPRNRTRLPIRRAQPLNPFVCMDRTHFAFYPDGKIDIPSEARAYRQEGSKRGRSNARPPNTQHRAELLVLSDEELSIYFENEAPIWDLSLTYNGGPLRTVVDIPDKGGSYGAAPAARYAGEGSASAELATQSLFSSSHDDGGSLKTAVDTGDDAAPAAQQAGEGSVSAGLATQSLLSGSYQMFATADDADHYGSLRSTPRYGDEVTAAAYVAMARYYPGSLQDTSAAGDRVDQYSGCGSAAEYGYSGMSAPYGRQYSLDDFRCIQPVDAAQQYRGSSASSGNIFGILPATGAFSGLPGLDPAEFPRIGGGWPALNYFDNLRSTAPAPPPVDGTSV
ncbi:hypothetical protein LTR36_003798 [Oleoguttula mirabilis]|uniref:Uncharacterized protein n=1 Tax=Oleoguttula mirabilis TaxID=1507867 RepID=A0AAV9JHS4_9PEZI|nr:hypothetical protein LTR36_003798 [Oleoguttula mirabilis]